MFDLITSVFAAASGGFIFLNILAILKQKQFKGASLWALLFFTSYAAWMLIYFINAGHTLSAITTGINLTANAVYFGLRGASQGKLNG